MTADATRAAALEKMRGFGCKIGFPDKWIDYAALEVRLGRWDRATTIAV